MRTRFKLTPEEAADLVQELAEKSMIVVQGKKISYRATKENQDEINDPK
ncbi:MAG TPA: hypothetical protein VK633_07335 [Verrucomicrobiae bacterium]|nr:hypothetical protein [Verrucomicrobiae bacterium]